MKAHAWIKVSNSHGFIGFEPIWLPEGETPKVGDVVDAEKYWRAPGLDTEIEQVPDRTPSNQ